MSIRKFEIAIGASNGSISRAINKGTDVYAKWISITVDKFPDLNPIWLLTGKGEMITEVTQGGDLSGKKDMKSTFSEKNVHTEIQKSDSADTKLNRIVNELVAEAHENAGETALTAENYLQQLLAKFDNMDSIIAQLRQDFTALERKVTGE